MLEEAVGLPVGARGFAEASLSWESDWEMLKSTMLKFTRLIAVGPRSYRQRWNVLEAERLRVVATIQVYCIPNVEVGTLSVPEIRLSWLLYMDGIG